MSSLHHQQIQEDEKLAIQAIYEKEAVFEPTVWKIWKPILVKVHLLPLESCSRSGINASHVSLDLGVNCTETYPDVAPTLTLENAKGVSADDLRGLREKLDKKMQDLLGSPMILELCDLTRAFLYDKNVPIASFHENMIKQHAIDLCNEQRHRANNEKIEFEKVVEERQLKLSELNWQKETAADDQFKNMDIRVIDSHKLFVRLGQSELRPKLENCIEWRGVFQGEDVVVSEWTFHHTLGRFNKSNKLLNTEAFTKLFHQLEFHLSKYEALLRLEQTIVPIAFTSVQRSAITASNIFVKVFIVQKILNSEKNLASQQTGVKSKVLSRLAAHAVCALKYLHDQQLSHGSFSAKSVWMSCHSFRFSDAIIQSLLQWALNNFSKIISGGNLEPFVNGDMDGLQKDLVNLGSILSSLHDDWSNSEGGTPERNELDNFIADCKSAKSIDDLLDHKFLVSEMLSTSGSLPQWSADSSDGKKSRLIKEFFILQYLGKGGFGDVMLARNKLDGNDYAIKRISLNPKNEKLNGRITREAKLFSKLNHPHVVRYYNAWIEEVSTANTTRHGSNDKKDTTSVEDSLLPSKLRQLERQCSALHVETSEWTTSYRRNSLSESTEDDDEENNDKPVITLFSPRATEDSFEICFEDSDIPKEEKSSEKISSSSDSTDTSPSISTVDNAPAKLLYIQMEYCERSTLRSLIDANDLFNRPKKIWKMFGEILSGLQYIHRQGMIHRDIKPMNILLDSEEHVKIGDFGLATRDLFLKKEAINGRSSGDAGQTRDIGTELYMAPELFALDDIIPYTSKIDVYSTGIVLFEMFYRPLPPGMERISTIKNIKTTMRLPNDFGEGYPTAQANLAKKFIESMLKTNAVERPSIDEIIMNDERPLVDIDDENFQKSFLKTIKKRSGTLYNWMLDSFFQYNPSSARNYLYDYDLCEEKFGSNYDVEMCDIREELTIIFRLRSFSPLFNHLLSPGACTPLDSELRSKVVNLLDTTGFVVSLPIDLRLNFVRYCCRRSIYRLKRFTFDRVFSKNESADSHPDERWECSVDCIAPVTASVTCSTELLSCVHQIADDLLDNMKSVLRIGHVNIIEAVLEHLTVPKECRWNVIQVLYQFSTSQNHSAKSKVNILSQTVGITMANSIMSLLPVESTFSAFKERCKILLKSRNEFVRNKTETAISYLEQIVQSLAAAQLTHAACPMTVVFDATTMYRPSVFRDGLLFMLTVQLEKKRMKKDILVLAGGRYDSMLQRERSSKDLCPPMPLCLYGCSISLNVLSFIKRQTGLPSALDTAIVCSFSGEFTADKFRLASKLWALKISTDILQEPIKSIEVLMDHCQSSLIDHVLVVFGKDEVLLKHYGEDHGKMDFQSAINILQNDMDEEPFVPSTPVSVARGGQPGTPGTNGATSANCNFNFAVQERLKTNKKRKIEGEARVLLGEILTLFSSKNRIEIIINELTSDLIKVVAGSLRRSAEINEIESLFDSWSKQYGKAKQDLEMVYQCFRHICMAKHDVPPIVILYSYVDEFFKVVL